MLSPHHVPHPRRSRRGEGEEKPAPSPRLHQAGATGHPCQRGLVPWDVTKLKGPAKWTYYYLYVILDIFSRYVVGWMIAMREAGALAKRLIASTCEKQGIEEGQLGLHAGRGPSMKSKPVEFLLVDLGVDKTHSRPHTSNDNPYSEAQFKTLKYRPEFPERFGCIQDARSFCRGFFTWYNALHRPLGDRLPHPGDGPLRACRGRDRCQAGRATRGIRLSPGALCESCSKTAGTAGSGLDQQAGTRSRKRGAATVNPEGRCLRIVDTLRIVR